MEASININNGSSGYDRIKELKKFDDTKMGVKGLSDSGITSIPQFFIHPPETLSDLKATTDSSASSLSIPVIDLSHLNSPTHRPKLIHQVKEAAKTWGFFQVINHGVPISVIDDTVSAIKAFHNEPFEVKSKHYSRQEGRGVMYASNNDLYRTNSAQWIDSLQVWMGPEPPVVEDIPAACRKEVAAWDVYATGVAENLMELLSEGLGLEGGKFKELTFSEKKVLVAHCYPHCPQPDLTMGIQSHTDPAILTVLLQNHVSGLQVKHDNAWVDIKPLHGALVINIGDLLQIISNGVYNSVQHRVLANGSKEDRISVVMFFNVNKWKGDDGHFGPLPELLSPENPPIYRDFTMQEFLENFFGKGLDSKSLIQKVKI
ncbi:hypothetical protein FNV43_RR16708 [Rhamnella rubrinervis]|uniref:Fe2OG dioxygenase domain-containing protein n=1 Tax=Rhamnella rubrinervis TaxID=2594499 RepID=A0A8K0MDN9_9ROSA|nr:hypothetical protein FNV43_RR16708 [Rhamnella rubrinervis]